MESKREIKPSLRDPTLIDRHNDNYNNGWLTSDSPDDIVCAGALVCVVWVGVCAVTSIGTGPQ